MAIKYLKKAVKTPSTDDHKTREIVQNIIQHPNRVLVERDCVLEKI